MTIRQVLGLGALAFSLFAASHGSAAPSKVLDVRVGRVDIEKGRVRAALLSGAEQGILPGDKGFFTKEGVKVPGSDFEIDRIGDRAAWAMTVFPTPEAIRQRTSLTARITTTRSCPAGGKKPDFSDGKAALLGRTPPPGFTFATVISTARATDTSFTFTIDRGTDDGVLPSSSVYAVVPASGLPFPYVVDITWVSATTAGGSVRGVGNPDEAARDVRKLGVETIACKKAK